MLIGAYRDNEVQAHDPLIVTVDRLREQGTSINRITLAELGLDDITLLLEETLRCDRTAVSPLAALVVSKTQGNPFFVIQFLQTLHDNGLLTPPAPHEGDQGGWTWSIERIEAMDITDNVVELVLQRLKQLPDATQHAVRLAACVGNHFDLGTLALVHEKDEQQTYREILPAMQLGLLVPISSLQSHHADRIDTELVIYHYRFLHDRVQQAAYVLIDESRKQRVHLDIGRLLLSKLGPADQAERLFEIVDHMGIGRELITDPAERRRFVRLNLEAGRKAKFATAYEAAARYLEIAEQALAADSWTSDYEYPRCLQQQD